jgi:G3E family GTPase
MILLNKVDLASEDVIKDAMETIQYFNHDAPIIPTLYSVIDKKTLEGLKSLEHQANYKQTMDMHLQKVCLYLEKPSKEDLLSLCQELTNKTDRIKGVYSKDQRTFYTEYINGKLQFEEIDFTGENYLILLSTKKDYLKANINEVLKKSKHAFSVCSLS